MKISVDNRVTPHRRQNRQDVNLAFQIALLFGEKFSSAEELIEVVQVRFVPNMGHNSIEFKVVLVSPVFKDRVEVPCRLNSQKRTDPGPSYSWEDVPRGADLLLSAAREKLYFMVKRAEEEAEKMKYLENSVNRS